MLGLVLIPIEVKYQSQAVQQRDVPGLHEFCHERTAIQHGYILTKNSRDIGPLQEKIMRIPAPLFCYWLGAAEFTQTNIL